MWALVGVPMESSGANRGEARAPAALREAGIAAIEGIEDHGDLEARILDPRRDRDTGVIGFGDLVRASARIAHWVAGAVSGPARPLVVGGDCSLLPGLFAGLRQAGVDAGLWMVDGHPDAYDGETSPTGEAADMDLTFLCGAAPDEIAALGDGTPLLRPDTAAVLGHRPATLDLEVARELALVPDGVTLLDAPSILEDGPREVGRRLAERFGSQLAWLHLDLDVLDGSVFPAVSYPQALGLDWEALGELVAPLVGSPSLVGISVTDLEADLDPERYLSRRVVAFLDRQLAKSKQRSRAPRPPDD